MLPFSLLFPSTSGLPCKITFILPKGKIVNSNVLVANSLSFDLSKNDFILTLFLRYFYWVQNSRLAVICIHWWFHSIRFWLPSLLSLWQLRIQLSSSCHCFEDHLFLWLILGSCLSLVCLSFMMSLGVDFILFFVRIILASVYQYLWTVLKHPEPLSL